MTAWPPLGSTNLPVNTPYMLNNASYPSHATSGYPSQATPGYPSQATTDYPYPQQNSKNPSQGYPTKEQEQHSLSSDNSAEGNFQPTTVPPLETIQKAPGYENTTFATTILPPPANPEPQRRRFHGEIESFSGISEEDVRDAAIQYASEHCCYGKDTVRDMEIKGITMSSAFHYKLETFAEKRETAWCYVPYGGEPLDTALNGIPPRPWEIPLVPPEQFKNSVLKTEVPHTASVMPCHVCRGFGRERCSNCDESCQVKCTLCNGSGRRFIDDTCTQCNGDGKLRCTECHGTGQMKCRTCAGKGNLKCYVKLTTTWTNHVDDYISEEADLPDELIRDVTGKVVFQEECPRVWPVNHFPQPNINEASKNLVAKHNQQFFTERNLLQKHQIRIVPVTQVHYTWKDDHGQFFVYGFQNKVYFPHYPQNCCWCCTIL